MTTCNTNCNENCNSNVGFRLPLFPALNLSSHYTHTRTQPPHPPQCNDGGLNCNLDCDGSCNQGCDRKVLISGCDDAPCDHSCDDASCDSSCVCDSNCNVYYRRRRRGVEGADTEEELFMDEELDDELEQELQALVAAQPPHLDAPALAAVIVAFNERGSPLSQTRDNRTANHGESRPAKL